MKWEGREESENVEDRRGLGTAAVAGGGGAVALVVYLLVQLLGGDEQEAKQLAEAARKIAPAGQQQQQGGPPPNETAAEHRLASFSKVVFHDTEVVWTELFRQRDREYEKPILVLFSGQVQSACGRAEAAVGPFYCPGDSRVYIDLGFYEDMQRKLNAPGEFARAYVIAHEVGHHVQRLLGYSRQVDEIRRRGDPVQTNHASVRLELQADYFAGVWAFHAQKKFNFLEEGDIKSALHAAFEIGDDRLRSKAGGTIVPDSFTHGTSNQRMKWFNEGFRAGSVENARALFDLPYNGL